MSTVPQSIWANLERDPPRGDALAVQLSFPDLSRRLFAAIDSRRKHHLLITLNDDDPVNDSRSRGLSVETRSLSIRGQPPEDYIDITCLDNSALNVFNVIGGEIADRLSPNQEPAHLIVSRILGKWRRFWGQQPSNLMSLEKQIGLFGELWFLKNWLGPVIGFPEAIEAWRGPHDARHDFELSEFSVEAKTTTSTRGLLHRIHGLTQLEEPDSGVLKLFSLHGRREAGASNSLLSLITEIRELVAEDPDSLGIFDFTLNAADYSPLHDEEYSKLRIHVISESLYRVEEGFPRIITSTFTEGLPQGIERIEYEMNLNTFDGFKVCSDPSEFNPGII